MPSKNESYPIIILEALNAGCKIIASDVGGIKENKSKDIKLLYGDNVNDWIESIISSSNSSLEIRKNLIRSAGEAHNLHYYIKSLEKNL